MVIEETNEIKQ